MGKYENGSRQIKPENGIKLKNGFDPHRRFWEAIDYGPKITQKIFPLNCSLETEKSKKVIQSDDGESKEQHDL